MNGVRGYEEEMVVGEKAHHAYITNISSQHGSSIATTTCLITVIVSVGDPLECGPVEDAHKTKSKQCRVPVPAA